MDEARRKEISEFSFEETFKKTIEDINQIQDLNVVKALTSICELVKGACDQLAMGYFDTNQRLDELVERFKEEVFIRENSKAPDNSKLIDDLRVRLETLEAAQGLSSDRPSNPHPSASSFPTVKEPSTGGSTEEKKAYKPTLRQD